jgi:UDP-perosamine 4-acetyltransferase
MNNTPQNLVLIGGGGHAGVVAATARDRGFQVVGYISPKPSVNDQRNTSSLVWLGDDTQIAQIMKNTNAVGFFPALGCVNLRSLTIRRAVLEPLWDLQPPPLIHPKAIVAKNAEIGQGSFVAAGAIISENCRIGRGCIINTGVIVDHDCDVEDGCHLATGTRISGGVHIASWCLIGAGSTVIQGLQIGTQTIIGAGSLLLKSVAAEQIFAGHPAKTLE